MAEAVTHGFTVGAFTVTTILDGVIARDDGDTAFGANREPAEVAAVAAAHGLDVRALPNPFVPVLIRTGDATILVDTGFGAARRPEAGQLRARLGELGVAPEAIDLVILTHLHPDHVGGLMEDGAPAFVNARLVTGRREFAYWTEERTAPAVEANVRPLADRLTLVDDGAEVAPGITAQAAFGHTPGHMIYHLESGGERLALTADTANHPVLSLARPDWHFRADVDPEQAVATRRRIFGALADAGTPLVGHHLPFPALGRVARDGGGFRWRPLSDLRDG